MKRMSNWGRGWHGLDIRLEHEARRLGVQLACLRTWNRLPVCARAVRMIKK
jgi:hypothetical protein